MRSASSSQRAAVPRHQSHAHLEVLRRRLFGQFEHLAGRRTIRGHRLLHEDIQPLLNGVGEMHPAEGQRRGEDRDVARLQAVHRLLVGVESDELTVLGHVDPIAELLLDVAIAAVEAILEGVGHGHQLDGAVLDRHGIAGRAAAAAAAADQGHLDRVVLGGMDVRDHRGRQGRGGGDAAGILQRNRGGKQNCCAGIAWVGSKPGGEGENAIIPCRRRNAAIQEIVGRNRVGPTQKGRFSRKLISGATLNFAFRTAGNLRPHFSLKGAWHGSPGCGALREPV